MFGMGATLLLPLSVGLIWSVFPPALSDTSVTTVELELVDPLTEDEAALMAVSPPPVINFFLQALMRRMVVMMRTNIRMRMIATATAIKYSNLSCER